MISIIGFTKVYVYDAKYVFLYATRTPIIFISEGIHRISKKRIHRSVIWGGEAYLESIWASRYLFIFFVFKRMAKTSWNVCSSSKRSQKVIQFIFLIYIYKYLTSTLLSVNIGHQSKNKFSSDLELLQVDLVQFMYCPRVYGPINLPAYYL